jgi:L-ornithine N5-oxygenase
MKHAKMRDFKARVGPHLSQPPEEVILDFVGVGFGPSNLAMAIVLEEEAERGGPQLSGVYLDAGPSFAWHPGMLLEGSKLQVVFLKDLVTLRNPCSRHSFLNFLRAKDRLDEFVNLRDFYPTRIEFNDYYSWVAESFRHLVRYNTRVIEVLPASSNGRVEVLRVRTIDLTTGETGELLTRNLLVGTGGEPFVPGNIDTGSERRAVHSSQCLQRLQRDFADISGEHRFVIVGSGQTAADIYYNLIQSYPRARITAAVRGFGLKPQDDTHFVNEIFFPEVVGLLYDMPAAARRQVLSKHRDVTHSAVDIDLLPLLYQAMYDDKALGRNRLEMRRFLEIQGVREEEDRAVAEFRNVTTGERVEIAADLVLLATGYRRPMPLPLLAGVAPHLHMEGPNEYRFKRSYCVETDPEFEPRIYLQGFCEATHGFSEVLLSLLPIRSQEILVDLLENRVARQAATGAAERLAVPLPEIAAVSPKTAQYGQRL